LDVTGRSRLLESDQATEGTWLSCRHGESLRVTIVYEPGEDGSIGASIPEAHSAHGQERTREEARGERDRREAEATYST
jgi:hypothetical protein